MASLYIRANRNILNILDFQHLLLKHIKTHQESRSSENLGDYTTSLGFPTTSMASRRRLQFSIFCLMAAIFHLFLWFREKRNFVQCIFCFFRRTCPVGANLANLCHRVKAANCPLVTCTESVVKKPTAKNKYQLFKGSSKKNANKDLWSLNMLEIASMISTPDFSRITTLNRLTQLQWKSIYKERQKK